jgi:hypothetical protein
MKILRTLLAMLLWGGFVWVSLFAIAVLLFIMFTFFNGERGDPRVEKPLKIKMLNDKPCFYIDPFEDMDRFVIRNLTVDHKLSPIDWDNQWHEGEFETLGSEEFFRPIGNRYLFTPSAMAGSDKCVEYGVDIDKNTSIVKELKTGVVYIIFITGYNKEQLFSTKRNVGEASFAASFYLQKNTQTGKLEAVIVKDNNQTNK